MHRIRRAAADGIIWCGLMLMALIAIPAAILIGIIYLIWRTADMLAKAIEAK